MVVDVFKGYVQLASGVTVLARDRAAAAGRSLAAQGPELLGAAAHLATANALSAALHAQKAADDLTARTRDNGDLLVGVCRTEVERLLAVLGVAREGEIEALRTRVEDLHPPAPTPAAGPGGRGDAESSSLRAALAPGSGRAAKATPLKKKAPAQAAPQDQASVAKQGKKKATAKKATAKKATAKKATAKKATAKKATAKKATDGISRLEASAAEAPPGLGSTVDVVDLTTKTSTRRS